MSKFFVNLLILLSCTRSALLKDEILDFPTNNGKYFYADLETEEDSK